MALKRPQKRVTKRRARSNSAALPADELARLCARAVSEKKGEDIIILDLREMSQVTDFFVIATGGNPRQLRAMSHAVQEAAAKQGAKPMGVEGADQDRWVLIDYTDVVVHIFDAEWRRLYDLDLLWGDAPRLSWEEEKKDRARPTTARKRTKDI